VVARKKNRIVLKPARTRSAIHQPRQIPLFPVPEPDSNASRKDDAPTATVRTYSVAQIGGVEVTWQGHPDFFDVLAESFAEAARRDREELGS
jgi:hypothetical protein